MSSANSAPTLISDPVAKALAQRMSELDMSHESREELKKMWKSKIDSAADIMGSSNDGNSSRNSNNNNNNTSRTTKSSSSLSTNNNNKNIDQQQPPIRDRLLAGFTQMNKEEISKLNAFDRLMMKSMKCVDLEHVKVKEDIYNELIRDFPTSLGKQVSKKDKEEMKHYKSALTYGEISFESFAVALEKIKMKYGLPNTNQNNAEGMMQKPGQGLFYDIGSGTGKPVFAAALMFPFEKVIGIELLDGLYNVSLQIDLHFKKMKKEKPDIINHHNDDDDSKNPNKNGNNCSYYEPKVEFYKADVLDLKAKDWSDGDVLFANSTCFDDRLMEGLGEKANCLRKGTFFVTLTRRLPNSNFKVLESEMYNMSWGGATVFIQQKQTDPYVNIDGGDTREESKISSSSYSPSTRK